MKVVILAALVALVVSETPYLKKVSPFSSQEVDSMFAEFQKKFSKDYSSVEHAIRRVVFETNLEMIRKHNMEYSEGTHTYTMGINQFADLTISEFKAQYLRPMNSTAPRNYVRLPEVKADSVDWRTKGAVTPVKNQGQCGSCWAFSTTGSTEGAYFIAKNQLNSVSEQQLVDCSKAEGNQGCNGGLMDYAFKYIIKNKGITSESNYPYTARDGACNSAKASQVVSTISGYADVPKDQEAQLLAAVTQQPVSVAIEADQSGFQMYHSGVFKGPCGTQLDHGVLAVGYNTDASGNDYWIVKNSWGASWGDQGYIFMARGHGTTGICGINMSASYPKV